MAYIRCNHIPHDGPQCDAWIKEEDGQKCILHKGFVSAEDLKENQAKITYIEARNAEAALCYKMTFDELDAHIAGLEQVIELEKAKMYSARAVRSDKLDKLSEEEREVRRKIKIEKQQEAKAPKKATIKSDPVKFFMQTYQISEAEAKLRLGLD